MRSTWTMCGLLTMVFSTGVVVGTLQQQASQTRREPQFDNDHVRVWKSIITPNQPLALHRHEYGRTIVALKGGTLDLVPEVLQRIQYESARIAPAAAYPLGGRSVSATP